ncbi:MAG: LamG domain-containing protein [Opitutaceae bacterium]|nr:LamG domain-containing protein [Opitutaceae bacterium]
MIARAGGIFGAPSRCSGKHELFAEPRNAHAFRYTVRGVIAGLLLFSVGETSAATTIAQWTFDEPEWLYPSHVMDSTAGVDAPLVLGLGGRLVPGKFGNALSTEPYPPVVIPARGERTASLARLPVPAGRTQEPLTWHNAQFCALMTGGERHLRKEVSFVNPTANDLNLGDFDWTVEFWLRLRGTSSEEGTVFEIGTGPRGENGIVTRLSLEAGARAFVLHNQPAGLTARLPVKRELSSRTWHHCALVYDASAAELSLFVDGEPSGSAVSAKLHRLPRGEEAYLSLGRDGRWARPLSGELDELRLSRGRVYTAGFTPPGSYAIPEPRIETQRGPPLLFGREAPRVDVVPLGDRKYLFFDDALLARADGLTFTAHPPRRVERVMEKIEGQFRKHLTAVDDEMGLIRIFNAGPDDYLMVHVSRDGVHFESPDTGIHHKGRRNIVIAEGTPLGRPIIDPNGPPETRWKYVSGHEGRGVYLYTSPDGWKWTRHRTAVLPFRSGSQSSFFYDDQRGLYVGYHRTGFPRLPTGGTQREYVRSEAATLFRPWPVNPLTQAQVWEIAKTRPLREPQPWWLDNGPLTPGDFGVELPTVFAPDPAIDPPGSGVYVPKATKYPWAPDAYVAFPCMYFHYEDPEPRTRAALMDNARGLGSGTLEVQLAVSRDGVNWRRFPRPAYVPMGRYEGRDLHQVYMAEGLVRRGDEIWQYFYGQEEYHSPVKRNPAGNGIYRAVQRLDGFVSADAPYDREISIRTRLLTFKGSQLVLNIDTGALGYAQVGILDEHGAAIPGFATNDCVYINTNSVACTVEWLGRGTDVSALAARTVQLEFRLRGASLYSLQFSAP